MSNQQGQEEKNVEYLPNPPDRQMHICEEYSQNAEMYRRGLWILYPGPGEFYIPPSRNPNEDQDGNKIPKEEVGDGDDGDDGADGGACKERSNFHQKEEEDDDEDEDKPKVDIQANLPLAPIPV
ncbi:hypothetical protein GCK72_025241 [Caenorhabditis remanei]|uniref:Uncharacterized protein n=1 Tax=Caenorhabditis remanei TaxID=31234 RepID=A0A6A5G2D3_CAERE|nr:hypothetical protein GCK72_025241 [Caenorhabditis remanei]KAF1748774.1 hypothetical protein GCK72_025241 [Caenorhabditis remanei]